jgi:capsular polysaccharide transport system permease protein
MSTSQSRSAIAITLSVWRALMLREAVSRLFASRISWIWVFLEPVVHISYLLYLYTEVRVRKVGELDTAIWLAVGLLGYFLFRRTADEVTKAAGDNAALFAYRQVKPIDTLLARGFLEGFMLLVVSILISVVLSLEGHLMSIEDPLALLAVFFGMWIIGVGLGLCLSALYAGAREARAAVKMIMRPLYLISGVMFPLNSLPANIREILMLNPLANGVELARSAIASNYNAIPETSAAYFTGFAVVILFLGLALQRRFAAVIMAR